MHGVRGLAAHRQRHIYNASAAKRKGQRYIHLVHGQIGLLRDPSAPTRENALDALVYFKPDDELLGIVRGIAEKDPETRMGDAGRFYPVRRTAAKLLKEWHRQ